MKDIELEDLEDGTYRLDAATVTIEDSKIKNISNGKWLKLD